jgi:hypothetical protein
MSMHNFGRAAPRDRNVVSSAGGSIGNDEKSLSGPREKPRAVEPSKPARRAKPEAEKRAVHREEAVVATVAPAAAAISMTHGW